MVYIFACICFLFTMAAHLCMHCACSPVLSLSIQAKQYKTQDKWLKQLASFRDEQVRSSCNNEKHGVMPAERESHLHITAEHELEHIYACQDQCEPRSPRAVDLQANWGLVGLGGGWWAMGNGLQPEGLDTVLDRAPCRLVVCGAPQHDAEEGHCHH